MWCCNVKEQPHQLLDNVSSSWLCWFLFVHSIGLLHLLYQLQGLECAGTTFHWLLSIVFADAPVDLFGYWVVPLQVLFFASIGQLATMWFHWKIRFQVCMGKPCPWVSLVDCFVFHSFILDAQPLFHVYFSCFSYTRYVIFRHSFFVNISPFFISIMVIFWRCLALVSVDHP